MTTPTDVISKAIDTAIAGDVRPLYDRLTRNSGLPGPRVNEAVLEAFAEDCKVRGARADKLILTMATLDPDAAPGGMPHEFLPVCGVTAIGLRAAADDAAYRAFLGPLHDCAEDLRFRVRDAVVAALAHIGSRRGDALAADVAPWMDGLFHAAAVVEAIAQPPWLTQIADPTQAIARFDEAFACARDAPRAAARYPGYKSLLNALSSSPRALAGRFGVPVFDMLVRWTACKDPVLREAIEKNLVGSRLAGRFAPEVLRVRKALKETTAPARNPDHYFGPTRGRGKKEKAR